MKLKELTKTIQHIHSAFSRQAGRSVNMALTMRNWLIGFHIKEYEQKGLDRADYGFNLLDQLSLELKKSKIPSTSVTNLRLCRALYEVYPQIHQTLSDEFKVNRMSLKNQTL